MAQLLTLAVVVTLFCCAYSSTLYFNQKNAFNNVKKEVTQKPCCLPKQFEAIFVTVEPIDPHHHHDNDDDEDIEHRNKMASQFLGESHHKHKFVHVGNISYDAQNSKVEVQDLLAKVTTKAIADYNSNKLYLIRGQKCKIFPIERSFQELCVPANATFLGDYSLGIGQESMTLQSWQFMIRRPGSFSSSSSSSSSSSESDDQDDKKHHGDFLVWNGSTTPKNCMLISETVAGVVDGEPYYGLSSTINATSGIADPSVFTPPTFCSKNVTGEMTDFTSSSILQFLTKLEI